MTAVTTFATLQTRLGEDCNRTDAAFTAALPGFIQSAEAEANRRLRVRQMITNAAATINGEYELVPTGFLGLRSLEIDSTSNYALTYLTPDALTSLKGNYTTAGKPIYFTIVGRQFQFLPAPDAGYSGLMSYWEKIPALSVSNTTNWLLDDHPDVYVAGAKAYAYDWLQDDARSDKWTNLFSALLDSIQSDDAAQSYGATLQARPSLVI